MTESLENVAAQFCADASIQKIKALGNGLINATFLVQSGRRQFVLQKLNQAVFHSPQFIMQNMLRLQQHILQSSTHAGLIIPQIIKTRDGQIMYVDCQGDSWRALQYVGNSESREQISRPQEAQQVGRALARFHRLTLTLDVDCMHDTLPGFHHTPDYLQHYLNVSAQKQDKNARTEEIFCRQIIEENASDVHVLEQAKREGLLCLRIIHGDPKLNNFLFAQNTDQIISLIDLDTVKPGLTHYDVGDCLRSCCHLKKSNEFDIETCELILQPYLSGVSDFFSEADYAYLSAAIKLIPFELGLRFYTDYLAGNTYFKVTHELQNLQRAMAQFELYNSIVRQESAVQALVVKLRC